MSPLRCFRKGSMQLRSTVCDFVQSRLSLLVARHEKGGRGSRGFFFPGFHASVSLMSDLIPDRGEFLGGKLWFERKGDIVTLGLTDSAIDEIGTIEDIIFPDEGEDFDKGEVVVTVDGTHGKLEIKTPAAGVVSEINAVAKSEPGMVSEDPLEEGWLVKLEIQDVTDLQATLSGDDSESDDDEDEDFDEDEDDEEEKDEEETEK